MSLRSNPRPRCGLPPTFSVREQLPASVAVLTAGVDVQGDRIEVQGDRIEVQILGWVETRKPWVIDYRVLWGDPSGPRLWSDLDAVLHGSFAQGARSQLAAAFETVYGQAAASGFVKLPFASITLGSAQPLLASELLGYTLVPYRSRPAADGPRYKALGNSMAISAMGWIGERIAFIEGMLVAERGPDGTWRAP